ncbi:hypothetical protein CONCODRAFT_12570 [Conidiobolus coronatus NRRL 28638]|uniref:Uncharacterized protein n=1 Tax=Conidiobolus coronatus (strain ATCC 28846 / CBS 209.66 / NRRL 28638) TaxID=796925 RepID=A0A137NSS2_CONC2|nr:hypothetical protein CONCODRAFT_12570 [Conidiobolus coronatus NRRL 28638]|eukprot:KXN65750.1 hypothetical protein CONCODRAFT_12570 [Conidiobolus coronatus NRRL 28638]
MFCKRELGPGEAYETNVTAIANAILELSGKTRKFLLAKRLKVVLERRQRGVRQSVLQNEKLLLVIECKHYSENREFIDKDIKQIQDYMTAIQFPYGMLLSGYRAEFLTFSRNRDTLIIRTEEDRGSNDIAKDIERIINEVRII